MMSQDRVRIIDTETTGLDAADQVVEIGAVDVVGGKEIHVFGSELVNPGRPIPPSSRAVHHISDEMVAGARPWSEVWPDFLSGEAAQGVVAYAAHQAAFDGNWVTLERRGCLPLICTWKCAMRQWHNNSGFSNQCLRYELGIEIGAQAEPSHRALPDAFVTGHILIELLKHNPLERLIEWSGDPAVYPTIGLKKYRGQKWSVPPVDYLDWIIREPGMDSDIVWNAKHEIARRAAAEAQLLAEERAAYVTLAIAAPKTAATVEDLNRWWASEAGNRDQYGIRKGDADYAAIATACANRKGEIVAQVPA